MELDSDMEDTEGGESDDEDQAKQTMTKTRTRMITKITMETINWS